MIYVIENESRYNTTKAKYSRIMPKLIGGEWREKLIKSREDFLNSIEKKAPNEYV
jgi:hypothetical protein